MTAELAVRLYGRILDRIEENGYDVFTRRASVPLAGKLAAVPRVVLTAWLPRGTSAHPDSPGNETSFKPGEDP
jgi:hypothetical protein